MSATCVVGKDINGEPCHADCIVSSIILCCNASGSCDGYLYLRCVTSAGITYLIIKCDWVGRRDAGACIDIVDVCG